MGFLGYIFTNNRDNRKAVWLFIAFFLFYMINNYPCLQYMKDNAAELAAYSPFYGAPFLLNLFNFDPSMYYGAGNTSIIHPFINFLSGPFTFLSKYLFGNLFFLTIQSVINALGVVMIYYYLRRSDTGNTVPLLFAVFFGISSYNLFTAMIPDSYPYAQFVIILSVLYLQYARSGAQTGIMPASSLALVNFAVTSTNIVPYAGALLFNLFDRRDKSFRKKWFLVMLTFVLMAVVVTVIQFILFGGKSWINTWLQSLNNGGFSYVSAFSFSEHWKAVYMLVISPVLTPDIAFIDPGIAAFVTDLSRPYPFYVHIIGFSFIALAVLGFMKGIRSKESWILAAYIAFAVALHIVVGYGLAAFKYDLYLYAGHFLFAFFLLAGRFVMQVQEGFLRNALVAIVLVFVLTTLGNNIVKHIDALNVVKTAYADLKQGNAGKK